MRFNHALISDVFVDGIDRLDAPDYSDAFIASALIDGREMTDAELELLNSDSCFVHEKVLDQIH